MQSSVNHPIALEIRQFLSEKDITMAELIEDRGPISVPVFEDHFYSLVMSIVYQQLSFKAAETIFNRLLERVARELTPQNLKLLTTDDFRALGVSRQKAKYIHDICHHFTTWPRRYHGLQEKEDDEVVALLCDIKGVGKWTAQMFLMFTLLRPDVFPVGDLGIRNAMTQLYGIPSDAPLREFEELALRWAPYRSYACHYLWHLNDQ